MNLFYGLILLFFLLSCQGKRNEAGTILQEWQGKEIYFPDNMTFTIRGNDTVDFSCQGKYKILSYVDSTGCTSCKLGLDEWAKYISQIDSVVSDSVKFLFFFCPKDGMEIYQMLRIKKFEYPICIDNDDKMNKLNHFPSDERFQTFLLDKNNRVLAVGNPVHNPKVKELYLKIIRGETGSQEKETPRSYAIAEVDRKEADMGRFNWREERTAEFVLKNTGRIPLVIQAVNTSCGCTRVEYDEKPARSGESIVLRVTYKANHPGHFRKLVTVFCNTEKGMLRLMVTGEAEERKK